MKKLLLICLLPLLLVGCSGGDTNLDYKKYTKIKLGECFTFPAGQGVSFTQPGTFWTVTVYDNLTFKACQVESVEEPSYDTEWT